MIILEKILIITFDVIVQNTLVVETKFVISTVFQFSKSTVALVHRLMLRSNCPTKRERDSVDREQ